MDSINFNSNRIYHHCRITTHIWALLYGLPIVAGVQYLQPKFYAHSPDAGSTITRTLFLVGYDRIHRVYCFVCFDDTNFRQSILEFSLAKIPHGISIGYRNRTSWLISWVLVGCSRGFVQANSWCCQGTGEKNSDQCWRMQEDKEKLQLNQEKMSFQKGRNEDFDQQKKGLMDTVWRKQLQKKPIDQAAKRKQKSWFQDGEKRPKKKTGEWKIGACSKYPKNMFWDHREKRLSLLLRLIRLSNRQNLHQTFKVIKWWSKQQKSLMHSISPDA